MAARVTFLPDGRTVELPDGSTLYAAAHRAGVPLAQACPGEGVCGRCGLRVLAGAAALSPEGAAEARVKADNRADPRLRLACQTRVRGTVVVTADYW